MRAIGLYMTKNILILIALVLLASTSNWVPLYTDGTLTGGGYEDSPLGVDTSKVATTYDLMSAAGGASYLVYTALLSQADTDAPTAIVLENTLGGTVVWTYNAEGSYIGTLTGAFTADKTAIFTGGFDGFYFSYRGSANTVTILTYDETLTLANDYLNKNPIEIRVYP